MDVSLNSQVVEKWTEKESPVPIENSRWYSNGRIQPAIFLHAADMALGYLLGPKDNPH